MDELKDSGHFQPESKEDTETLNKYPVLRFFQHNHLPGRLQDIARPFRDLAWTMANYLPYDPETSTALRKLLEAKDAAVRSETVR